MIQVLLSFLDPSLSTRTFGAQMRGVVLIDLFSMTLDSGAGPLAGGTITVNGIAVVVPKNTIATLPATAVSWPELFTGSPAVPNMPGYPNSQSWTVHVRIFLLLKELLANIFLRRFKATGLVTCILPGLYTSVKMHSFFKALLHRSTRMVISL
jgi:hypothetical protein